MTKFKSINPTVAILLYVQMCDCARINLHAHAYSEDISKDLGQAAITIPL